MLNILLISFLSNLKFMFCICVIIVFTSRLVSIWSGVMELFLMFKGGSRSGGRTRHAPPPKIGKNMIFWHKIVIFHTKYPKNFRASLRNWKEYEFLA